MTLYYIFSIHVYICYKGMCYIVCNSGKNVITFIIPFFLYSPHVHDDVHSGERRGWSARRLKRNKPKKKKFSSTSFIFGVAAATGSKCYFIWWNCEELSLCVSVHYLWKKESIKFTKHNFYIVEDFSFIIYCTKVELLSKWTNFSWHFLSTSFSLAFYHISPKLHYFIQKANSSERERASTSGEIKRINTVKGSDFILNIFLLNRHMKCGENSLKYTLTHLLFIVLRDIKNKGRTTWTSLLLWVKKKYFKNKIQII